jgi:hypothetical protein
LWWLSLEGFKWCEMIRKMRRASRLPSGRLKAQTAAPIALIAAMVLRVPAPQARCSATTLKRRD